MLLSLVSHASTSALRRAAFPVDEPIDSIGNANAQTLAGLLPVAAHTWSSTALRTLQTATALQLDAIADASLDDCDYGLWAGRHLADLQQEEPEAVHVWLSDPSAAPHGGESLLRMQQRVNDWMSGLDKGIGHAIAVTHPAVIRLAILGTLEAKVESFWRIDVSPLSLTQLRFSNHRWTLVSTGRQIAEGRT